MLYNKKPPSLCECLLFEEWPSVAKDGQNNNNKNTDPDVDPKYPSKVTNMVFIRNFVRRQIDRQRLAKEMA